MYEDIQNNDSNVIFKRYATFYTANVLDAKIATKSSVTFPAALRMPFLQLLVAANY